MPITDNTFTPEELTGAFTANPELAGIVASTLKTNKYIVQSEKEHEDFLKNHEAVVVARKTGEHATSIEKDVFELTGVPKEGEEKYYDYMKRAFGAKIAGYSKLEKELTELKAKGDPNSVDKARISELEKAMSEKETTFKDQLQKKESEILETRASFAIGSEIAKLRGKYKENIPQSLIELAENTVVNELKGKARMMEVDGKMQLAFVGEDGKTPEIDRTTMQPATAEYFVIKHAALKDLIDPGRQQGGSGTDPKLATDPKPGGADTKYTGLPSTVKTKVQLTDHLKHLGIMQGSTEFDEIFSKDGANLPLR